MRKGEAFRGTSRRTPLGSITTMRGERGMGSNVRRQGRHTESPPGAIQHAMVGKLRPEVRHLQHLTGVKSSDPPRKAESLCNPAAKAGSRLATWNGLKP